MAWIVWAAADSVVMAPLVALPLDQGHGGAEVRAVDLELHGAGGGTRARRVGRHRRGEGHRLAVDRGVDRRGGDGGRRAGQDRSKLGHEGVVVAPIGGLQGVGGREVGRIGDARHVGVAGRVHGDAIAIITAAAAEVGGVDQGRARRVQLRHEGVGDAPEEWPAGGWRSGSWSIRCSRSRRRCRPRPRRCHSHQSLPLPPR